MIREHTNIEYQIAVKAREEWVRKTAKLRVKAQQLECEARSNSVNELGEESPRMAAYYSNVVAEANEEADQAERLAREWDAKAKASIEAAFGDDFLFDE